MINFQENTSPRILYTSCVVLFFISMLLTAFSARNPWIAQLGYKLVSSIVHPVSSTSFYLKRSLQNTWESYVALIDTEVENANLKSKVVVLEKKLASLEELAYENDRLRQLLTISAAHSLDGVAADVIGSDSMHWVQAVTINKGSDVGLSVGQPVIAQTGVYGRLIAVAPKRSKVLLVTDPNSGVDAYVQNSRGRGVVEGSGGYRFKLNYVLSDVVVNVGDNVFTTGLDEVFPKSLLIGKVARVRKGERGRLFQNILVEPVVDFSTVETVFVINNSQVEEQL